MKKWALAFVAVLALPAAASAQDATKGKAVFLSLCSSCHMHGTEGKGTVGPNLKGVVGAKSGGHDPAYASKYSPAMKAANLTWDEATLDKYLSDWAKKTVPNTLMNFMGIKDAAKRADVIAYLKSE